MLGLRPEARVAVTDRKVLPQRIDRHLSRGVHALQPVAVEPARRRPGGLFPARLPPAFEQPGPFELMAGLDQAALAAQRPPVGIEKFAQHAGLGIDKMAQSQARQLVAEPRPARGAGRLPGQSALEKMHVAVGLVGVCARFAIAALRHPAVVQRRQRPHGVAGQVVARHRVSDLQRGHGQQRERLFIDIHAGVERGAVDGDAVDEQAVRSLVVAQQALKAAPSDRQVPVPVTRAHRRSEDEHLPSLSAGAPRRRMHPPLDAQGLLENAPQRIDASFGP